jgi:hypothetical protein
MAAPFCLAIRFQECLLQCRAFAVHPPAHTPREPDEIDRNEGAYLAFFDHPLSSVIMVAPPQWKLRSGMVVSPPQWKLPSVIVVTQPLGNLHRGHYPASRPSVDALTEGTEPS